MHHAININNCFFFKYPCHRETACFSVPAPLFMLTIEVERDKEVALPRMCKAIDISFRKDTVEYNQLPAQANGPFATGTTVLQPTVYSGVCVETTYIMIFMPPILYYDSAENLCYFLWRCSRRICP
jgi:hypothetical protein